MQDDDLRRQLDFDFGTRSLHYELVCRYCNTVHIERTREKITYLFFAHVNHHRIEPKDAGGVISVMWYFKSKVRELTNEEILHYAQYLEQRKKMELG